MIKTWHSFLITAGLVFTGFVITAFYPDAPYITLCSTLGTAFTVYAGKRLIQKRGEYGD